MSTKADSRHRRIAGIQSWIAGALLALVALFTGTAAIDQTIQNREAVAAHQKAERRAEFWREVAGTRRPNSTSASDTLAADLRDLLGRVDSTATSLPRGIGDFRSGFDLFGGVESELGMHPFSSNGQLSAEMRQKLLTIKRGAVEQLISEELAANPVHGLTLTPLHMPVIIWLGIVYLGGGTFAAAWAIRKDRKDHSYTAQELNWRNTGGTPADTYKLISKTISPAYFLVWLPLRGKLGKDYEDALKEIGLFESFQTVKQALRRVDELPYEDQADAKAKLEELLDQINEQVGNHLGSDRFFQRKQADAVKTNIDEVIDTIGTDLRLRSEARREVDAVTNPPDLRVVPDESSDDTPHQRRRRHG